MNLVFDWSDFPLISSHLAGTGGRIRSEIDDFCVSENPAYQPSGEGEFTYIRFEKRGHTTKFMLEELHRQLGVPFKDFGVAGLKDRHAVTMQWISVPQKFEARLGQFQCAGIQILDVSRHHNKLGMGHLHGNTFKIRVRDTNTKALENAQAILNHLVTTGIPNYFGIQRFGKTGGNATRGLELLLDGRMKGRESIQIKRFLISSLQSLLFNHNLRLRLERGVFEVVLLGDVVRKFETGGTFVVEDVPTDSARAKALELSSTAPLYGRKIMPARLDGLALETEVLGLFGLDWQHFHSRKGARRSTRIKLENANLRATEDGYWLEFTLPKGSFATVLLREVMKNNVDVPEEESDHQSD
ncbi:MAG: tRNA pseudouridine(13) synthase TruD [Deinococcales bacterium]